MINMFDFNGSFGAYAFHEEEIERSVSALASAYRQGLDINDPDIANAVCQGIGVDPFTFSSSEIKRMNREIEKRLSY